MSVHDAYIVDQAVAASDVKAQEAQQLLSEGEDDLCMLASIESIRLMLKALVEVQR